jgi:transcription elongation factor Elf1
MLMTWFPFVSIIMKNLEVIKMEDEINKGGQGYPRTFACPFCCQEFTLMNSVFDHMDKKHVNSENVQSKATFIRERV